MGRNQGKDGKFKNKKFNSRGQNRVWSNPEQIDAQNREWEVQNEAEDSSENEEVKTKSDKGVTIGTTDTISYDAKEPPAASAYPPGQYKEKMAEGKKPFKTKAQIDEEKRDDERLAAVRKRREAAQEARSKQQQQECVEPNTDEAKTDAANEPNKIDEKKEEFYKQFAQKAEQMKPNQVLEGGIKACREFEEDFM